jgi:FkbM family methyltransferase
MRLFSRSRSESQAPVKHIRLNGVPLNIADHPNSEAVRIVAGELVRDAYRLERIPFRPGDVVVDIGAHVGMVSTYLGKRFPYLKIFAYEPIPQNFQNLELNLRINKVTNVKPRNMAVTSDGRNLEMTVHFSNSGGASAHLAELDLPDHFRLSVRSTTLDAIFADNDISRCRVLKLDCEGTEHEILHHTRSLDKIDFLVAEFHINNYLSKEKGFSLQTLIELCEASFDERHLTYSTIKMAE